MAEDVTVTRIGDGVYHVVSDGRNDIVYVTGSPDDRWAFWNGQVYHVRAAAALGQRMSPARGQAPQALRAPMPATVVKVLVSPGAAVKKGDTVILLEAMKMELPIRAPADGTIAAVHCHEGELVQPDVTLVEFTE